MQALKKLIRHILSLLFILALPLIFFREGGLEKVKVAFSLPYYWFFCFLFFSLTYLNYYLLIPKFYLRKKYGLYALIIFGLFFIFYLVKPFDLMIRQYVLEQRGEKLRVNEWFIIDLFTCFFFIIFVAVGMAVRYFRHSRDIERKALQAEAEKANAELSFLKAQVNPHFLYNTLNNIYSLSEDQHPDTSESILKLSNIMRYLTDEATQDFVPLETELAYLRDYISLQELRLDKNVKIEFKLIGNPHNKFIAPLLLITYIENAFKYGVSSHQAATITIRLTTESDHISFYCRNQLFPAQKPSQRAGIGLKNTRKRLQLLYPGKHQLDIDCENGFFTVNLTLEARHQA